MEIVIKLFKGCFNILYSFMKLFGMKNKIVFCSRQSDDLSIDYKLLQEEIKKRYPDVKIVNILKRFQDKRDGVFSFFWALLRSTYHISTSKVCVLDGYWPIACILDHRPELKIVQIWHSVGKIKKSGYQTLDTEYGRSRKSAELLCMHKKYDYIISGGKAWNQFYCESFNVDERVLRSYGLPRLDHLITQQDEYRKKVLEVYPEFKEKKVVLYAPTFRKNQPVDWRPLAEQFEGKGEYAFLCKFHPNDTAVVDLDWVYTCPEFSSLELMCISDYLITDYSSLALEGAAVDRKIYYYVYDYEEYLDKNGVNMDVSKMMPTCTFKQPDELFKAIDSGQYDMEQLAEYKKKYLPEKLGHATELIVDLIGENL